MGENGGGSPRVPYAPAHIDAVFVLVSHIQRISCQPPKGTLHGGQSYSWSAERGKDSKTRKSGGACPPPPLHTLLVLIVRRK